MDLFEIMNMKSFPLSFLGIIVFYLSIKHKKVKMVFEGLVSSLIGYYMVLLSTCLTKVTLAPISLILEEFYSIKGGMPNSELFAASLLWEFGSSAILIMFLGFTVNILLARITNLKGVYLTSHHLLYLALTTSYILNSFTRLSQIVIIILGGVILGVWCLLTVSTTSNVLYRITNSKNCGMANSCAAISLISAKAGQLFGNKKDRYTEKPIDANIIVLASVSLFIVYFSLSLLTEQKLVSHFLSISESWVISSLIVSIVYGVQVALVMKGIHLLISNISNLFWDLAQLLVPDLKIGLDASAMVSYSPRAWYIGFLYCSIFSVMTGIVLILFRANYIPVTSLSSSYFVGGIAGTFGNAYGGKKGAKIAGLIAGIVSTLLISTLMSIIVSNISNGICFGETDYGLYGLFLYFMANGFIYNV